MVNFRLADILLQIPWWWVADKTPITPYLRLFTVSEGMLRWSTNLDYKTRPATFEAGKWQFTCKRVVK